MQLKQTANSLKSHVWRQRSTASTMIDDRWSMLVLRGGKLFFCFSPCKQTSHQNRVRYRGWHEYTGTKCDAKQTQGALTSFHHLDGGPSLPHGHLPPGSVAPIHPKHCAASGRRPKKGLQLFSLHLLFLSLLLAPKLRREKSRLLPILKARNNPLDPLRTSSR